MHHFEGKHAKNIFLRGKGHSPSPDDTPTGEGAITPQTPPPSAPSALPFECFRHWTPHRISGYGPDGNSGRQRVKRRVLAAGSLDSLYTLSLNTATLSLNTARHDCMTCANNQCLDWMTPAVTGPPFDSISRTIVYLLIQVYNNMQLRWDKRASEWVSEWVSVLISGALK